MLSSSWHTAPRSDQLGSKAASCLFPTVLLPCLHQGRMEEINETPQRTLPSPRKLGPRQMPQLPGRPGLAQPLGLIPPMMETRVAPAQVDTVAKRRGVETQTLPPSIRESLECVTHREQVPSSHQLQPCQTCPRNVPCPKAQTAPRPPAAEAQLSLLPPPNTTASLHTPHPENPKYEHKYQSRKISSQNVQLNY